MSGIVSLRNNKGWPSGPLIWRHSQRVRALVTPDVLAAILLL